MGQWEPTEKAIEALSLRIAKAWLANASEIYPEGAEGPDPKKQADVAARACWGLWMEYIDASKAGPKK